LLLYDATAATRVAEKFHIFHERHVWKSTSVNKGTSPAENSVIAASHPEQEPCVMRKAVRQSVYDRRGRQADSKKPPQTLDCALSAQSHSKIPRHFGVHARTTKYRRLRVGSGFICFARLRAPLRITDRRSLAPVGRCRQCSRHRRQ
jgi:hypothetical protein